MRAVSILLGFVLMTPLATAASGVTVEGHLTFAADVDLEGSLLVEADRPSIDLSEALRHGESITVTIASASGYSVEETQDITFRDPTGAKSAIETTRPRNESWTFGAATLRDLRCRAPCLALLVGQPGATAQLGGESAGTLHFSRSSHVSYAGFLGGRHSFYHERPAGWLLASGEGAATRLAGAALQAEGHYALALWNVSGVIETAEGAQAFATGEDRRPIAGVGDVVLIERSQTRFLVLDMDLVSVASPAGTRAILAAEGWSATLDGEIASEDASGHLVVDGRRSDVEGESVLLEGAFRLAPAVGVAVSAQTPAKLGAKGVAEGFEPASPVFGRATRVLVSGEPLADPSSASALATPAATLGAIALLAAIFAGFQPAWLLGLYSRIGRDNVLANPNRARAYEVVKTQPGVGVAALARELGVSRIVATHHLRMLLAHRLVLGRRTGARMRYFSCEDAARITSLAANVVIADPSRRRVADAVRAEHEGATQAALVARTGITQRLVSYHLGKLVEAGLVESLPVHPKVYRATGPLASAPPVPEDRAPPTPAAA